MVELDDRLHQPAEDLVGQLAGGGLLFPCADQAFDAELLTVRRSALNHSVGEKQHDVTRLQRFGGDLPALATQAEGP